MRVLRRFFSRGERGREKALLDDSGVSFVKTHSNCMFNSCNYSCGYQRMRIEREAVFIERCTRKALNRGVIPYVAR